MTVKVEPALSGDVVEPDARPRTLSDLAYVTLRDAIITSRLEPGSHLRQEELARQFGMSVIPIRDALRRLETTGLIEFPPHRGATVAGLALREITEVIDLQMDLELPAVRRAAADFDAADLRLAEEALRAWESAIEDDRASDAAHAHQRFHLALYRAQHSSWLIRLLVPLWETSARYWHTLTTKAEWTERAWEGGAGHAVLLDRCAANDGDGAHEVLRRHLTAGRGLITAALVEA